MHVLLTNDDGIHARGLEALYKAFQKVAKKITIVAPDSQRSSTSQAISLLSPLFLQRVSKNNKFYGYGLSGTPADCVKFAVDQVIKKDKPDIVISGINCGPNEGCSVWYSGTVGAAREAAMNGFPAIAMSVDSFDNPDYTYAAKVAVKLAKQVVKEGLPNQTLLNVNVPDLPAAKIKGKRITYQGKRPIYGKFERRVGPYKNEYFWITAKAPRITKDLTDDINALATGYVTITPIKCDQTDCNFIQELEQWNIK